MSKSKPARVPKPRPFTSHGRIIAACHTIPCGDRYFRIDTGLVPTVPTNRFAREFAAWLIRAAAWCEQEDKR